MIHRLGDCDQHGETAAVVADAGPEEYGVLSLDVHIRPVGKDRVQMGRNHDMGMSGGTRTLAEDITGRVDADVLQSTLLEHPPDDLGARHFPEGRRGNLRQANLRFEGLRFISHRERQSGLDRRALRQGEHERVLSGWHLAGADHDAGSQPQHQRRAHVCHSAE
jgi:hypothetical protein